MYLHGEFRTAADDLGDLITLMENVPDRFDPILTELKSIGRETANVFLQGIDSGRSLIDVLGDVLKQRALLFAADKFGNAIDHGLNALFDKAKIPGFASGTASAPGGLAYVHKNELIDLPRGSRVWNASETAGILGKAQQFRVPPRQMAPTVYAPLMQISAESDVVSKSWVDGLNLKLRAVHDSAVEKATKASARALPVVSARFGKLGTT